MQEFSITKRLNRKNRSLAVFRMSYSKTHNDLKNLFNFSLWLGQPNKNKSHGSYEIFIFKHKGLKIPRLVLTDWNKRIQKQKLES